MMSRNESGRGQRLSLVWEAYWGDSLVEALRCSLQPCPAPRARLSIRLLTRSRLRALSASTKTLPTR